MRNGNVMRNVKVERQRLIGVLTENKKKHEEEYVKSIDGYQKLCVHVAKKNLQVAKNNKLKKEFFRFPTEPVNYSEHYDRALSMLEYSVEDVIDLDEQTFNQLVLDEWNWTASFKGLTASYIGG